MTTPAPKVVPKASLAAAPPVPPKVVGPASAPKTVAPTANRSADSFRDAKAGAEKLSGIAILKGFTKDELASIYKVGTIQTLRPKANAVIEGEPTRGLFIILEGSVSVYKNDPVSGSLLRIATLQKGAHFGELSFFDDAPRSATVVADTECHLFSLDARELNRFLEKSAPDIRVRFYKKVTEELSHRVRNLNSEYLSSQQLLWKYVLRKESDG